MAKVTLKISTLAGSGSYNVSVVIKQEDKICSTIVTEQSKDFEKGDILQWTRVRNTYYLSYSLLFTVNQEEKQANIFTRVTKLNTVVCIIVLPRL